MKVLSLFDGMGCLGIALKDMGIRFDYYTSEVDKHAMNVSKLNFPDSVQLGDVTKWKEWDIPWGKIELIGAGSPCQGFSFAGKQLAFDDPRSALFFTFVEILEHCRKHNPNVLFLLENVRMKKEHELVISRYMGIHPIEINSSLVSAQSRQRNYWTNIYNESVGLFGDKECKIPQPKDRGILLKDILEEDVDEKYFLSEKMIQGFIKHNDRHKEKGNGFKFNPKLENNKGNCLTSRCYKMGVDDNYIVAKRGRKADAKKKQIRRLTPTECARLQTIPDWYNWANTSDTQIYKMLGNGWCVEVIKHILFYMSYPLIAK